jgi:hypothetical protein
MSLFSILLNSFFFLFNFVNCSLSFFYLLFYLYDKSKLIKLLALFFKGVKTDKIIKKIIIN